MPKYNIAVARLVKVWLTETFEVEADSMQKAVDEAASGRLEPMESGFVFETIQQLSPIDNRGEPTVKIEESNEIKEQEKERYENSDDLNEYF